MRVCVCVSVSACVSESMERTDRASKGEGRRTRRRQATFFVGTQPDSPDWLTLVSRCFPTRLNIIDVISILPFFVEMALAGTTPRSSHPSPTHHPALSSPTHTHTHTHSDVHTPNPPSPPQSTPTPHFLNPPHTKHTHPLSLFHSQHGHRRARRAARAAAPAGHPRLQAGALQVTACLYGRSRQRQGRVGVALTFQTSTDSLPVQFCCVESPHHPFTSLLPLTLLPTHNRTARAACSWGARSRPRSRPWSSSSSSSPSSPSSSARSCSSSRWAPLWSVSLTLFCVCGDVNRDVYDRTIGRHASFVRVTLPSSLSLPLRPSLPLSLTHPNPSQVTPAYPHGAFFRPNTRHTGYELSPFNSILMGIYWVS